MLSECTHILRWIVRESEGTWNESVVGDLQDLTSPCFNPESGTDRLSRNVGSNYLPIYAA
jgi:hypothetical protein